MDFRLASAEPLLRADDSYLLRHRNKEESRAHHFQICLQDPEPGRELAMSTVSNSWLFWAGLSALFAALTAIFAKVGVDAIDSDLATFFRTFVVLIVLAALLLATGKMALPNAISGRSWLFLILSGLGTGASWLCYFRALKLGEAARVAPIDKLSVVLVALFGVAFLGERLSVAGWVGIMLVAAGGALVAIS